MLIERDGRIFVQGPMTMVSAASLLAQGEPFCASADRVLDLAEVEHVDSSALAVVLAWLRSAKAAGRSLRFANPPKAFTSLAALYGVDAMLASFMEAA